MIATTIGTSAAACVADRLDRLRHDAVVGGDDEHRDVGGLRTAGAHGGERLVPRRVDERDQAFVLLYLVRTDVLSDAAGLTRDHVALADAIEQRGLAVVDMTHHGDDRRARREQRFVVVVLAEHRLELELGLLARLDEQHLGTERLGDELDHLVGEGLRAGDHLTRVEQKPHEVGGGAVEERRVLLDRDPARNDDLTLGDRRVLRREVGGRRRTEVLEVATTPLLAPGPLTLRAGATATAGPTSPTGTTRTATGTTAGTAARATTAGRRRAAPTSRERRAAPTTARVGREDARAATAATTTGGTAGCAGRGRDRLARRAAQGCGRRRDRLAGRAAQGRRRLGCLRGRGSRRPVRRSLCRGRGRGSLRRGRRRRCRGRRRPDRSPFGLGEAARGTDDAMRRGRPLGERLGLGQTARGTDDTMRHGHRGLGPVVGRLGLGDLGRGVGGRRGRGPGRGTLLGRLLLGWLLLGLGLVDDGVAPDALRVGETADAVRHGVLDARGVALHADLELGAQLEAFLVAEAQLTGEFVDPDLLRQGRSARLSRR